MTDVRAPDNSRPDPPFVRNLLFMAPVDGFWGFAAALIAVGPIITVLLQRLGATNLVIGLAPALMASGNALLQLPAAHWARRLRAHKTYFVWMHVAPSLTWSVSGVCLAAWGQDRPGTAMVAVLALMGIYSVGISLLHPLWGPLLARFFVPHRRGLATGIVFFTAGLGSILGGLYATATLGALPFPANFARLFMVAGLCMAGSIFLYLGAVESPPAQDPPRERTSLAVEVRRLVGDRRLRRLLLARYFFELGSPVGAFFAVYLLAKFSLPDQAAGGFTLAAGVGSVLISPLAGRLGDTRGYRRVLGLSMVLGVAAGLLAWLCPSPAAAYVVFLLAGMAGSADFIALINLLVEMCDEHDRPYYQAVLPTLCLPVRLIAPLLWGFLGDRLGLAAVLPAGVALVAVALVLLLALVDDPRRPGERLWPWGLRLPAPWLGE